LGVPNNIYTLVGGAVPAFNADIYRTMTVARTTAQNFTVVVTLLNGAKFSSTNAAGAPGRLPLAADVTVDSVSNGAAGAATFTIATGGGNGSTSVTFLSNITTSFQGFPIIKIAAGASGWTILDPTNRLATGTIQVQVQTSDAADGTLVDGGGTDSCDLLKASGAVVIPTPFGASQALVPTTAVVDVATNRQNFVANPGSLTNPDTTTTDVGASVGVGYATPRPLTLLGANFALANADKVVLTFTTSDNAFTGLKTDLFGNTTGITWGGTAATGTGTSRTITIAGDDAAKIATAAALPFVFTVNGTTSLPTRVISVAVDLSLATALAGGSTNGGSKNLQPISTVTTWSFNGSVLVANWLSGDSGTYKSRIYLWNPSATTGAVTVRVFSLPVVGATPVELTTAGSPLSLGNLAGNSGVAIRLAEDILGAAGLNIAPYTANGGNIVVEVTIRASNVRGTCQVFSSNGAMQFGQVPLQVVQ